MTTQLPPDVLTTQQAARLLGVSPSSVQKMVSSGVLQAWVTPGGHRRIFRSSVEQFARECHPEGARQAALPDSPPMAPDAWPAPAGPVTGLNVLLAEDDPDQVAWFGHALAAHGPSHLLTVAHDASQALILLERQRPDLVVTDLVMQPFDGFHLVRTIVAEPAWAGMEVLVVSGLGAEEIVARGGLPAGVATMVKPLGLERLFGFLDGAWARRQARTR